MTLNASASGEGLNMYLLIDIGNSRLKWTVVGEEIPRRLRRLPPFAEGADCVTAVDYQHQPFSELAASLWHDLPTPTRILVANVAGKEIADKLTSFAQQQWRLTPEFLQSNHSACGVQNGYSQPHQLGVDRWLAMLAAWHYFHCPLAIFDCGSAFTVDVIDATGQHLGGLITPGLSLLQEAYQRGTRNGKDLVFNNLGADFLSPSNMLGKDTQTGITFGSYLLLINFIKQFSQELGKRFGMDVKLLLTGGDAEALKPHLPHDMIHRPHLVLEGLALLT
jgi:type III pantothenate kinase